MKKTLHIIFLLLILCIYLTKAQQPKLIWENVTNFALPTLNEMNRIFIDNDNNIFCLLSISNSEKNSYCIKYNSTGALIFNKELYSTKTSINTLVKFPFSIQFGENGFKIYYGIYDLLYSSGTYYLPFYTQNDNSGELISDIMPYNTQYDSTYQQFGFVTDELKINTIAFDNLLINSYHNQWVKISETLSRQNYHIIINAYDSLGNMLWKKGYDTLGGQGGYYLFRDIKKSKDNSILALFFEYLSQGIVYQKAELHLLEIDLNGNVLNRIDLPNKNYLYVPEQVIKFSNGNYAFLCKYLKCNDNMNFLCVVDSKGNILKQIDLPSKYIKAVYSKLFVNENDEIFLLGQDFSFVSSINEQARDKGTLIIKKLNQNLQQIWEIESDKCILFNNGYIDIAFGKNDEFIVSGYHNDIDSSYAKEIFIAKYQDYVTDVEDNNMKEDSFRTPDVVSTCIMLPNLYSNETIQIFSTLGSIVYQSDFKQQIDVSGLPPGMYFIKIGNKVQKFVKM